MPTASYWYRPNISILFLVRFSITIHVFNTMHSLLSYTCNLKLTWDLKYGLWGWRGCSRRRWIHINAMPMASYWYRPNVDPSRFSFMGFYSRLLSYTCNLKLTRNPKYGLWGWRSCSGRCWIHINAMPTASYWCRPNIDPSRFSILGYYSRILTHFSPSSIHSRVASPISLASLVTPPI